ncbi:MAG: HAD family hydrolase, partial [Acidothermaceae bacterium]
MTAEAIAASVIAAVTVDLDDTLFPQAAWLGGAWEAVAAAGQTLGLDADALHERLVAISAAGSDGGRIVDRALLAIGCSEVDLPALTPGLLAAFRSHSPDHLDCYPGVTAALVAVRGKVPVACITDGDPHIQRAKLRALGLADSFDAVIFSDELGRQYRKPHPAPFLRALDLFGVDAAEAVHVGDRPTKDVVGPESVGMRAVRVRTGEYKDQPDDAGGARPWQTYDDAAAALTA